MIAKSRNSKGGFSFGFSLIEVMVALVIIGVALGAVIKTVGTAAQHEAIIGEKTFARWVAMNQAAAEKLKHSWPSIGTSNGTDKMANIDWAWKQKTLSTADENVRRIEISVWKEGHEKSNPNAFLVGFLPNPNPKFK